VAKGSPYRDLIALQRSIPDYVPLPPSGSGDRGEHDKSEQAYATWLAEAVAALGRHCGTESIELLLFRTTATQPLTTEVSPNALEEEFEQISDFSAGMFGILANPRSIFSSTPAPPADVVADSLAQGSARARRERARVRHTLGQIIERLEAGFGPTPLPVGQPGPRGATP
jgi:hypothetical protein